MSVLRPFSASDMFKFNNINLDVWTETYGLSFYLNYLSTWPDLCYVQAAPSGRLMGYILGNAEGSNNDWHGHVTALTVAPEYRRLSIARKLTALLEFVSDTVYHAFFVDLFVRCKNEVAIEMYEGMGYSVWRRIREYYGTLGLGSRGRDEEDAFDMRKPLSRDSSRRSVRPNGREMIVDHTGV
ncbi:N-acetyltransferase [Mycena olivaceomarginata]|uniref:N-acetyltransferase n=1 Tax=Mycena albidolilacea TaxID=1033008 RepID=A0AAD7EZA9_9AGAR|nr:N-acetyltransferase [Mycena albidolilacea]KAJ7745500.1 N-acetyltransferase [Mycena olivaceomarginata]KAJ7879015.1 N-acetyltransferase [Mycena olivaceomarginata]